jgi:hypothetical protein
MYYSRRSKTEYSEGVRKLQHRLGTGGAAAAYITVLLTHGRFTYEAGSHLIYTLERPYNSFRDSFDRVGS